MTAEVWTSVFAPASVSNVGPGFDAFGFALETPGDIVHARRVATAGIHLVSIEGDDGRLPTSATQNTAAVAAASVWRDSGADGGLELRLVKGMPLCSGLGSSAASAVAGAVAAMLVAAAETGGVYQRDVVLRGALAGEQIASRTVHADNVAPSLDGGFTIVQSVMPPVITRFEPAGVLHVAVVTPEIAIRTEEARSVLPVAVPLAEAVANWANAAALVYGLVTGDDDVIARSLIDHIVEPHRSRLVPGFTSVRSAALAVGALGCTISGSGPTLFALARSAGVASAAAEAMTKAFAAEGLASFHATTRLARQGARLLP